MTATAVRHCDAGIGWRRGVFHSEPVTCGQVVGVATVIDATGTVHGACSREGHEAKVIRRFGQRVSEAEMDAAHEASVAEMRELADGELPDVPLAGWTEAEARAAFGDR